MTLSHVRRCTRLLSANPPLEMLYRIKLTWHNFSDSLSASDRELTQFATRLEEKLARLDQLDKTWQATLQSAKESGAPPEVLQRFRVFSTPSSGHKVQPNPAARGFLLCGAGFPKRKPGCETFCL
jgi:hypothetical protein